MGVSNCSMFCCTLLYVHSSIASSLWGRESWLLCLFVFLVSSDGCATLPRGAMGFSAVCDCGIS